VVESSVRRDLCISEKGCHTPSWASLSPKRCQTVASRPEYRYSRDNCFVSTTSIPHSQRPELGTPLSLVWFPYSVIAHSACFTLLQLEMNISSALNVMCMNTCWLVEHAYQSCMMEKYLGGGREALSKRDVNAKRLNLQVFETPTLPTS